MVGEMARTLTLGQRRFAEAIVEGKKPIDAYRAAYPGRDTGAYAAASRLLRHPLVILEMMNIRAGLSERPGTSVEALLERLEEILHADMADYLTYDNNSVTVKDMSELTPAQTRCIESITITPSPHGPVKKLKLYSKMEAAGRISKIKGYGADTNAGEKTYVILAPTPDVDSATWLNRIKAEDARRKAVEAQLADGEPQA